MALMAPDLPPSSATQPISLPRMVLALHMLCHVLPVKQHLLELAPLAIKLGAGVHWPEHRVRIGLGIHVGRDSRFGVCLSTWHAVMAKSGGVDQGGDAFAECPIFSLQGGIPVLEDGNFGAQAFDVDCAGADLRHFLRGPGACLLMVIFMDLLFESARRAGCCACIGKKGATCSTPNATPSGMASKRCRAAMRAEIPMGMFSGGYANRPATTVIMPVVLKSCRIARVVKLVDTRDLKSRVRKDVPVRFRSRAPGTCSKQSREVH